MGQITCCNQDNTINDKRIWQNDTLKKEDKNTSNILNE